MNLFWVVYDIKKKVKNIRYPISRSKGWCSLCISMEQTVYLRGWTALQYIPRNMHTVFALLCFVVVIYWLIFPYPSGLLHWHCGNLTIAPVPAKQPWWIWINTSCEFIMNDCITTTKQSTTKPCAYFLGYTVCVSSVLIFLSHTWPVKTLRPRQNGCHFAGNIFKLIFLSDNYSLLIQVLLNLCPMIK